MTALRRSFAGALWVVTLAMLPASHAAAQKTPGSRIIATDVVLEPDDAMLDSARKLNARLRRNYPDGFALDSAHAPHITLVQRYIRVRALDDIAAVVTKALRSGPNLPVELTATSLVSDTWTGLRVVAILIEPSAELKQLARRVTEAVQPFAIREGSATAFAKADDEKINTETIKYVEQFVPASSGEKYRPHVTVGVAKREFAKALEIAPFDKFKFRGVKIAIYQLGNFGVAQKQLWP